MKFLLKHVFQSCDKGLLCLVSQEWKKKNIFQTNYLGQVTNHLLSRIWSEFKNFLKFLLLQKKCEIACTSVRIVGLVKTSLYMLNRKYKYSCCDKNPTPMPLVWDWLLLPLGFCVCVLCRLLSASGRGEYQNDRGLGSLKETEYVVQVKQIKSSSQEINVVFVSQ